MTGTHGDHPIEPDDSLADLTDEEQIAIIDQTDNGLTPEDEDFEQPLPTTTKKEGV